MNSKRKIALTVAIVALILSIAAGYTFSKYFQSINGQASAQIAAWSFKANAGSDTAKLSEIRLTPTNGE